MIDTRRITQSTAKFAAVIPLDIPRSDMMQVFGPAVSELPAASAAQDIQPNGLAFAHHRRMIPERFDLEVGFLIGTPVKAAGRVKPGTLPAATVARTVYHGAPTKACPVPGTSSCNGSRPTATPRRRTCGSGMSLGRTSAPTRRTGAPN